MSGGSSAFSTPSKRAPWTTPKCPTEAVTAASVLEVLDEFGGLVETMEAFTRENPEAIYRAANLRVIYHPAERKVDLAVALTGG